MSEQKPFSKNLIIRTITGLLFIAVIIGGIAWSSYSFLVVFLLVTILCLWEFYRISIKERIRAQKYYGILLGVIVFLINYFYANKAVDSEIFIIFIPLSIFVFIFELYRDNRKPFSNIAYTFLGIIYIAVPFSLMNYLVHFNDKFVTRYSPQILLGFFFILWTYDTGAYLVGTALGRKRMFERLSPKKSWEGAIGGALIAGGLACLISVFYQELNMTEWLVVAGITIIMGTYGDLTESMFKRSLNLKDTGKILPGHGGVLDRFD
ncbi:MAG: phosphatidate cytidylyltransferase, partial [Bacteroidetes bacterium]|nr:phosphatidate cytidylyltransferase [Bacteroidota bacterium]